MKEVKEVYLTPKQIINLARHRVIKVLQEVSLGIPKDAVNRNQILKVFLDTIEDFKEKAEQRDAKN